MHKSKTVSETYSVSTVIYITSIPLAYETSTDTHDITLSELLFPWKTIYDILFENKLWMDNWPIKCLMPAEIRDSTRQPKGIADLRGPEIHVLGVALGIGGSTTYPLVIHKASGADMKSK